MLRELVSMVATLLRAPRVIFDRDGFTPYLSRWYLSTRPTMPDGGEPFDELGNPKLGIVWPDERFGIYLHRFHKSDAKGALHNHPWTWACSFVLAGGYSEEVRIEDTVVRREVRPFSFNWVSHEKFHRVDLLERDAWSIFVVGPKVSSWEFWEPSTGETTPWRVFLSRERARSAS